MTGSPQKVYLLTEAQRDALLSYLQERPYKEVAAGIEFLLNATTAMLSVQSDDAEATSQPALDVAASEGNAESI